MPGVPPSIGHSSPVGHHACMTMEVPPLVACLMAGAVQQVLTRSTPTTPTSRRVAAAVGVAAVATMATPVVEFRRSRTTVDPRADADPSALVTSGVNAVTRNPMYVGMAGLLLSGAIRRPTPLGLVPLLAFVAWLDRGQIPREEALLQARFGEQYDRYRARVPRWVPLQPSRIARSARR